MTSVAYNVQNGNDKKLTAPVASSSRCLTDQSLTKQHNKPILPLSDRPPHRKAPPRTPLEMQPLKLESGSSPSDHLALSSSTSVASSSTSPITSNTPSVPTSSGPSVVVSSSSNTKNTDNDFAHVVAEGMLCKYTNVVNGWKNRWFVLNNDLLEYYEVIKLFSL